MDSTEKHPWQTFLDARLACMRWMAAQGKTPDEIARDLSMDGDQVVRILMATAGRA
jgi:hypothetical protein